MNSENSTNELSCEQLAEQIVALGFLALESLRGVSEVSYNSDSTGETWRNNVSKIASGIQYFCFGIRCQIDVVQNPDFPSMNSALLQINALEHFVVKALDSVNVVAHGSACQQQEYVRLTSVGIQDFCDSIAVQICADTSRGQPNA